MLGLLGDGAALTSKSLERRAYYGVMGKVC